MDIKALIEQITAEVKLIGAAFSGLSIDKQITLGLALYGSILSTYLGVREWNKGRRQLVIFLEYLRPANRYRIIITNKGHRSISLLDIAVVIPYARLNPLQIWEEKPAFPVTLSDGEHIAIPLSEVATYFVSNAKRNIWITIRDTENNQYGRYKTIFHDERSGTTDRMD